MTPHSVFCTPHSRLSRRACLRSLVGSSLPLPGILAELAGAEEPADPLAPKILRRNRFCRWLFEFSGKAEQPYRLAD